MSESLPYNICYEFIEDNEAVKKAVKELEKHKVIAVDTETTGLDPYTSIPLLVQVATPDMCYVFDCSKTDITLLKGVMEDASVLKILQNAKFDYKVLKVAYDITINNLFCTMSAERLITARLGAKASLAALSKKYLNIEMKKEIRKQFVADANYVREGFSKEELEYAANDAVILFQIYDQQVIEIMDRGLLEVALLEFKICIVTAEMEIAGCLIDISKWKEILKVVLKRRNDRAKILRNDFLSVVPQIDLFGEPVVNLDSPAQILKCLNKLGVRTGAGIPLESTDKSFLARLAKKYPVVSHLSNYKKDEVILKRYGEEFLKKINKKTGRLHAGFNPLRAATGRYSSSEPNLQQIPGFKDKDPVVDFRSCFIAGPGRKMVVADYSQQELRILADASKDPVFANAYKNNEDRHAKTASDIFGVPLDKVTKEQRNASKAINFGLIYGAAAKSISDTLNITEEKAVKLIEKYFKSYPKIKPFLNDLAKFGVQNRYIYTVSGRKRYFAMPDKSHPEYMKVMHSVQRQAKNCFIQGSAADVTKMAMIYVYDELLERGLDAKILMVIHDELVLEVEESIAEEVKILLEDCMIRGFTFYFKDVPMVVDAVVSDAWYKG
jgi:DNA polymerase I-like protein with 3'-5' exonuclease and polymerase domains